MAKTREAAVAVIGIDIGKYSFHIVGLDRRGAIVLRQKWSRSQVEARLANTPSCLIGMEACVGATLWPQPQRTRPTGSGPCRAHPQRRASRRVADPRTHTF